MTQPTWIKCSEQMPPDDLIIIYRGIESKRKPHIWKGEMLNISIFGTHSCEWTPYTKKTWEELNERNN